MKLYEEIVKSGVEPRYKGEPVDYVRYRIAKRILETVGAQNER